MLNIPWLALPYVHDFAQNFTVVVVSPRGYGLSTRLRDGEHVVWSLVSDTLAVCDHIGLGSFALFGYSFSTAVSAWMASQTERVSAVIGGGFPLLGDYARIPALLEERLAPMLNDPVVRASLEMQHDFDAGMTFYRHLAAQPPDSLVDRLQCRLFTFWGTADENVSWLIEPAVLERRLRERGAEVRILDALDHEQASFGISALITDITEWLQAG